MQAVQALVPFAKAYTTSHSVTNARTRRTETGAHLYALVEAQHVLANDTSRHFLMKNRYDISLARLDARWTITRMRIFNIWSSGDVGIMTG